MPTTEAYSFDMQQAVARQLRDASPDEFERLRSYYQRRGGPGLALLQAEITRRHSPNPEAVIRPLFPS